MSAPGEPCAAGSTALVVIDMINDLDCDDWQSLLANALPAARAIDRLCRAARAAGVPVVYVNDHFGQWHSNRDSLIAYCRRPRSRGRELVDCILPDDCDHFVTKPHFSGFYATSLPALLPRLGASRLVLTGIAADMCVLFTAADAHMREYQLWVPRDCVASACPDHAQWALGMMRRSMGAATGTSSRQALHRWLEDGQHRRN